jgi:hypothetical protein
MRITRTLAIKSAVISGVTVAVLSGPAVAVSTAIAPAAVPLAATSSAHPNMYYV